MSVAEIRAHSSGISRRVSAERKPCVCCGRYLVVNGGPCVICLDEDDGLADLHREQVRIQRQKRQAREIAEMQKGWRKSRRESWTHEVVELGCAFMDGARSLALALPGWVYALGVIALVNLWVWEYRGFFVDWFSMWFGGK